MTDKKKHQTIFRTIKNEDHPFVMIDRRPIENVSLSWGAKGVLAYLLSRPDNWTVRLGDLVKRSTDGVYKIRGYIKELVNAGHIHRVAQRDPKTKRIIQYTLEVYELAFSTKPLTNLPQAGLQQAGNLMLNNNDLNEKELNGADAPLPLDWQIGAGFQNIVIPDDRQAQMKDAANLIATGAGVRSSQYYSIAYAFMVARDIVIPQSKIKGQRKAIREMIEMNVEPRHVADAVKQLVENKMTVVDLFSVSKTAAALANEPHTVSEYPTL